MDHLKIACRVFKNLNLVETMFLLFQFRPAKHSDLIGANFDAADAKAFSAQFNFSRITHFSTRTFRIMPRGMDMVPLTWFTSPSSS